MKKRTKVAGVIAGAIGVLAAIGIATGTTSQSTNTPVPISRPPAAAPADTIQPAPATTMSPQAEAYAWYHSQGGKDQMSLVMQDLTQLSADATALDVTATEADGLVLQSDATVAASNPPPVSVDPNGYYTAGMKAFADAGLAASNGDFATATTKITEGTALIQKATAEVTALTS